MTEVNYPHKVGWIGVGRMGYAIAARLLAGGVDLTVYNRTKSKAEPLIELGARVVDTPAELGGCDIVFTMVGGPQDVLDVTVEDGGVLSGDERPSILVDATTIDPSTSVELSSRAAALGTAVLAAPVSGNPKVVSSGGLTVVSSGPKDAFDTVAPYLELFGKGVTYVGEGDEARLVKICHNLMLGIVAQTMAETCALVGKAGVSRYDYLEFLNNSVMGSVFTRYKSPAYVNLDFKPTFTWPLLRKDLELGLQAGRELEVPLPASALVHQIIQEGIGRGLGEQDFAALVRKAYEESGQSIESENREKSTTDWVDHLSLLADLTNEGHTQLFIGGEWRESGDGVRIDVLDPSNAESLVDVASGGEADARDAVDAAYAAQEQWSATSPQERSIILRRAFELMIERRDELAELVVQEMGKALSEAAGEATYAAEFFRWYSGEAVRNAGSLGNAPGGDKKIIAIHQPVGVSLLITPWNFPLAMATRKIGPAIAAGCTMILKPASDTPLSALAIAGILADAGLPPGVLNVMPSNRSSKVVPVILADERVRLVSFTGSTEVGRGLLAEAAKTVVNTSMELGGNAPFVVFDDADVEAAVAGAMIAKMRNGGQSCIAANRFLVHEAVADDFTTRLSSAMNALKVGPGLEPGVELGPLINQGAQDDMVQSVELSIDGGSVLSTGGSAGRSPGFYFEPTVIADVRPGNPILSREVFGPIAPVVTFTSDDEAISMANDTIYGLASYVYTEDLARGMRTAEAIDSGMVGLNRGLISDPAAPFGGTKQSGIGREGGHEGMMEFLETKYIAANW